ncbi:beta-barrel fold lipoprotein [Parabacteroides sp. PF5-9]|uniref:beta-barrel fold lipoprotein n=1 Tax=Parabacteroides sp. PF5-9 TaxID=1742404 RepID=UPI0024735784|nr:beta-barrel fold lipoprotein [Parabacteroides sp. PF5-9]MDH6357586.1 hypothetical protein [Parabacteroides sp. PF5-9]
MKSKFLVVAALFMVIFFSCGGSGDNDPIGTIGVHKIVVELSGSDEVNVSVGFQDASNAKLYDSNGQYKGTLYSVDDKLKNVKKVVCSTDGKGNNLFVLLTMISIDEGTTCSYSIKAYINDKLVDELKGEKTFTSSSMSEMVELFTNER